MAISTKLCWLLFLALLALILPSHCYTEPDERHEQDKSPEERLSECLARCGKQLNQQYPTECQSRCADKYQQSKQQEEQRHGGGGGQGGSDGNQEQGGQGQQQEGENPYYFPSSRFKSKFKSQEGEIKVLERFNKKSKLLEGVENNRLRLHVANPQTVILPHHTDAASIFVVLSGEGSINYLWPSNQRRSFNLKAWDVIRVPAGSLMYLVNHHNNEKFYLLEFLRPINVPGNFKTFFGTAGENPGSFMEAFSDQVLEAAFKISPDEVHQIFVQNHGAIVKGSQEQIRALAQDSERKEGKEEIWGPVNLYQERQLAANEYGQHFEVSPEDHDQFRDLDVSIGLLNISQGGMTAPYYNSRATKLVFVVDGEGKYEMVTPHLGGSKGSSQEGQSYYQRVTANLRVGDAFVLPNGRPIAIYATQNKNLQLISFGVKGSYNAKYFLAGQNNVWEQIPAAAREVTFGKPAQSLDKILKRQDKADFVAGPGQQQQQGGGRGRVVESILDFAGF